MHKGAKISEDGLYRYFLWREWDPSKNFVTFVMLNPSTADGSVDDPTIRRCIGFARDWGFGELIVVNLFAYRTAYPAELKIQDNPVGPKNDQYIKSATTDSECGKVICAWGANGNFWDRDQHVKEMFRSWGVKPYCLGMTKDGKPRHPLYIPKNVEPVKYN